MTYDLGLIVELTPEQLKELAAGRTVEIDLDPAPEEDFDGATVIVSVLRTVCECNCGCEPTAEWHADPRCVCRKVRCPCAVPVS